MQPFALGFGGRHEVSPEMAPEFAEVQAEYAEEYAESRAEFTNLPTPPPEAAPPPEPATAPEAAAEDEGPPPLPYRHNMHGWYSITMGLQLGPVRRPAVDLSQLLTSLLARLHWVIGIFAGSTKCK